MAEQELLPGLEGLELETPGVAGLALLLKVPVADLVASEGTKGIERNADHPLCHNPLGRLILHPKHLLLQHDSAPMFE